MEANELLMEWNNPLSNQQSTKQINSINPTKDNFLSLCWWMGCLLVELIGFALRASNHQFAFTKSDWLVDWLGLPRSVWLLGLGSIHQSNSIRFLFLLFFNKEKTKREPLKLN